VDADRLAQNLAAVRARMEQAAERAGRVPADVRLVAVTKTVDAPTVQALCALGVRDVGENRVVEGLAKVEAVGDPELRWHFVGHLQRNKAARALEGFRRIHSVESEKLVAVLAREAAKHGCAVEILLEVNVSGEESKYGLAPEAVAPLVAIAAQAPGLTLRGLMAMAPWTADPEAARGTFRGLREIRDRVQETLGIGLPDLSMGMSNDFEVAIEEGATLVRIGSALFA